MSPVSPVNKRARRTPRKSVLYEPRRYNTLKRFAPLSITNLIPQKWRIKTWLRAAYEPNFEVERTKDGVPDDIFDEYYRSNPQRHHVWTDHLVIREDTPKHYAERWYDDVHFVTWAELKRCNQDLMDDPESHFYLKSLGGNMGYGLFARHPIRANTIIGEYTGELITQEEYEERRNRLRENGGRNYFFSTYSTMVIDASAMGNHTRYINHDCGDKLNCRTQYVEIGSKPRNFIISKQDIAQDEQIFIWYGKDYFRDEDCQCGSVEEECITKNRKRN